MNKQEIGDCILYQGDCMEVLPLIETVEHIITDPPYEKEAHRKDRRVQKRSGIVAEALDFGMITEDLRSGICEHAKRISEGWFIAFCQAEGVAPWQECIEDAGIKYKVPMIWIKPDGMPQFNGQHAGMGYESMVSAWCGEGRSYWNGGGKHGVYTFPKDSANKASEHKTEKPIKLMTALILDFTKNGDTVLDPFMGSGTTGVACVNHGRKFIGIELEEKYFDISCKRIEEAYKQPDMFVQAERTKYTQESLI
jgi:DNA modification methylase